MKVVETELPGVWMIEPTVHADVRGTFAQTFHRDLLRLSIGYDMHVVQQTRTMSRRGVLRGLHYQLDPPQGQVVSVSRGAIIDVLVDVRAGSPTFGRWFMAELSEQNRRQVFAVPGLAHGYIVLSEEADVEVLVDQGSVPGGQRGVAWNDPYLGIPWPMAPAILSERDRHHPPLGPFSPDGLPKYDQHVFRAETPRPSCFISYSFEDSVFVQRLYEDLKRAGVPCWFAPDSMVIGKKIRDAVDAAVRDHDLMLLVLSRSAIESSWVEAEVEAALEKEHKTGKSVIVPIRLDRSVFDSTKSWVAAVRRARYIGDFVGAHEQDRYEQCFSKLLDALRDF